MSQLKGIFTLVFVLIISMLTTVAVAQTNPNQLVTMALSGGQADFELYTDRQPTVLDRSPNYNRAFPQGVQFRNQNNGVYRFEAQVAADFQGKVSFVVEYRVGQEFWASKRYMPVDITIDESEVILSPDYFSMEENGGWVTLNVLGNDLTSHGPLEVGGLSYVQNGMARVTEEGALQFRPDVGFSGLAHVNYIVTNALGKTQRSHATIRVGSQLAYVSSYTVYVDNESELSIILPSSEFVLLSYDGNGEVLEVSEGFYHFRPDHDFVGEEVAIFQNEQGNEISYQLHVLDNKYLGYTRKDYAYVSPGAEVEIDVYANDIRENPIVSYSPELVQLSNGVFSYQAGPEESGIKTFSYRTYDGTQYITTDIDIEVSHFYPDADKTYQYQVLENEALVLNYDAPIQNYQWNIVTPPHHGSALSFGGNTQLDYECGVARLYNMVVYRPEDGYIGQDNFEMEYCVEGSCRYVFVDIDVVANDSDECACIGPDCVVPGDTNNDGTVNMLDILQVANEMGAQGPSRGEEVQWKGYHADDWNELGYSHIDAKHADANGDGHISIEDVEVVKQHYGRSYNIKRPQSHVVKNYPIRIIPSVTDVEPGDFLELDIWIGDEHTPVQEVHGLSYTLALSAAMVDSASAVVRYYDDNWLGNDAAMVNHFVQSSDGVFELASTRTTGRLASGIELVHTLGITIEDDLDGFRPTEQRVIGLGIVISNISGIDGNGVAFSLPDIYKRLNYHIDGVPEDVKDDLDGLHLYPNPVENIMNIHVDHGQIITTIQVMDVLGRYVINQEGSRENTSTLDLSALPTGVYTAIIATDDGVISKKIEKFSSN